MNILFRAYRLFQSDGASAVVLGAWRKLAVYFEPFYQRLKPEYSTYSVDGIEAEFDMTSRRLDQHDFVDDLRSEQELIKRVLSSVEEDNVFYDIGANIGIYACLVGAKITKRGGSVVAFEPVPSVFDTLERNLQRNGVNSQSFNVALANQNGTSKMSLNGKTGHQLSVDQGTVNIETRRADEFISEYDIRSPSVCKFDIEGAEYLALDGFRQTLANSDCRLVFCEIHTNKIEQLGGSAEDVENLLVKLGFEIEYLDNRRDNYFIKAKRPQGNTDG